MRLANVSVRVLDLFRAVFRPFPDGTIQDWASGKLDPKGRPNIQLSSKESGDFAGGYDPDLNPLPTILFEVFRSGEYRKAVFKKSSQSGVTLAVLILICYFVSFVSRNFLYVIDSLDEMRRVSKERLQPMLRQCRAAARQIPEKEDDMKTLTLSLLRCVGYLAGAQSLGALSNKSVGLAVYDETDAYPGVGEGGETAVDLGSERGKKQSTFFEVLLSKPIEFDGIITQQYLVGTRHKCFLPCPHCGTMQELRWTRVRYEHCRNEENDAWDFERVVRETYYDCINGECDEPILEHHKPAMLRGREWRRTNFGKDQWKPQPGVFSCEITDLYSTFPTATMGILAKEFVESENNPSARQKFWRGRMAQGRKRKKVQAKESDIWNMTAKYKRGQCPVEPDIVLMFADVQDVEKKWVKCGFLLEDDTCYVIDYGACLSYGDLLVEADVPVRVLEWRPETPEEQRVDPVVYKALIDEGFRQKESRTFAASTLLPTRLPSGAPDFRFFTSWGQGGMHSRSMKDLVVPGPDDPPNIRHNGYPMFAYRFSDDNFKNELSNRRIGGHKDRVAAHAEGKTPPEETGAPLWFPADIDAAFVSEMIQETFEFNPKTGKWGWKIPQNPNDYYDGVKGCLIAWYIVKPPLALEKVEAREAS